jgi:hypothetical protein
MNARKRSSRQRRAVRATFHQAFPSCHGRRMARSFDELRAAVLRDIEPKRGSENVLHGVDQCFGSVGQSRRALRLRLRTGRTARPPGLRLLGAGAGRPYGHATWRSAWLRGRHARRARGVRGWRIPGERPRRVTAWP